MKHGALKRPSLSEATFRKVLFVAGASTLLLMTGCASTGRDASADGPRIDRISPEELARRVRRTFQDKAVAVAAYLKTLEAEARAIEPHRGRHAEKLLRVGNGLLRLLGGRADVVRAVDARQLDERVHEVAGGHRRLLAVDVHRHAEALLADGRLERLEARLVLRLPAESLAIEAQLVEVRLAAALGVSLDDRPGREPSLASGARLYRSNCASCHGAAGRGDGGRVFGIAPPRVKYHGREEDTAPDADHPRDQPNARAD